MNFRDYTEIVFEPGNILSAEMLEETYRYPREFLHLNYAKYDDGIITGLDFEPHTDGLHLTGGIVKLLGKYFILPHGLNLDAWLEKQRLEEAAVYCLFFECEDPADAYDSDRGIAERSRLVLKIERNRPKNSVLLARYKCRHDVKISLPKLKPDTDKPFNDFFQSGFLQLLDNEYSHPQGGTTYHPLLFRAVKDFLVQKSQLSPYDFSLLMEIQNRGIVSRPALNSYISATEKVALVGDLSREKLFKALTDCIQRPYYPPAATSENLKANNSQTTLETWSGLIED